MQLIIDVGNTRIKMAVFDGDQMIAKMTTSLTHFVENLGEFIGDYPIKKAIISSVGRLSKEQSRSVQLRFPTVLLSHTTPLPFINEYATPETLGVDRMALVAAFAKAFPLKLSPFKAMYKFPFLSWRVSVHTPVLCKKRV